MTAGISLFVPPVTPGLLTFNMKHISTKKTPLPSFRKVQPKVKKATIQTLNFAKKRVSWMVLGFLFTVVIYSNIAYAGRQGTVMFNDMTLGGPLGGSENAEITASLSNILLGDALQSSPTSPNQQVNILASVNAPEGYTSDTELRLVREYLVQEGDTLESIAQRFGISQETVAIENGIQKSDDVKEGMTLRILPTDGVKYVVTVDSDLEAVASKYGLDLSEILTFNGVDEVNDLPTGSELVLAGANVPDEEKPEMFQPKPEPAPAPQTRFASNPVPTTASVPEIAGYFGYPTTGRNYGRIHSNNGVDISNSCGTPIVASADGFVNTSQDGWNGGYGSYMKITHPNGTQTVYAHLSVRNYGVGTQVSRGQVIGLMGTTGRSTGCHLHFEVRGARNPLGNY
jgi:murein DD-endopeptidase MepM/ murein hydrolase activator NlpD